MRLFSLSFYPVTRRDFTAVPTRTLRSQARGGLGLPLSLRSSPFVACASSSVVLKSIFLALLRVIAIINCQLPSHAWIWTCQDTSYDVSAHLIQGHRDSTSALSLRQNYPATSNVLFWLFELLSLFVSGEAKLR